MWSDHLSDFFEAADPAFDFLLEEKGYFEPAVHYGRAYSLEYDGPTKDYSVTIEWDRYEYVPFLGIKSIRDEGIVVVGLQELLKKLDIHVDTSDCPLCEKLADVEFNFLRKIWVNLRRRREVLDQLPRFLKAYGDALRANYDAVLEQVQREPVTFPVVSAQ